MKMNCRIKLKDNVKILAAGEKISAGEIELELNPTEQMILHHLENYDLKEISVILREFYQMDAIQADELIKDFVMKLQNNNMINILHNTTQFEINNRMHFEKNSKVELIVDDDGTGILRDFSKGKMLFINKSGVEVWRYIEEKHSFLDMIDYFIQLYNVRQSELVADMEEFIKSLLEKDFIIMLKV